MLRTLLLVGIGGAIGSMFRYLTTIVVGKYFAHAFPIATLITNIIGCFLIGLLMGYFVRIQEIDSELKWFLVTGFCGGYTTFSAFGFENISLIQSGNYSLALAYIAMSIILGLCAVGLGLFLIR